MPYARPWLSYQQQLDQLIGRGITVTDRDAALSYLERIGLAKHIDPAVLARGSLLELLDETVVIMAAKLRQARAAGSLKDCLEQMNLLELLRKDLPVRLSDDSAPVRDSQKGGRKERKHHEKKVRLKMVEGENKSSAMTTEEKKNLLKTFKVIK